MLILNSLKSLALESSIGSQAWFWLILESGCSHHGVSRETKYSSQYDTWPNWSSDGLAPTLEIGQWSRRGSRVHFHPKYVSHERSLSQNKNLRRKPTVEVAQLILGRSRFAHTENNRIWWDFPLNEEGLVFVSILCDLYSVIRAFQGLSLRLSFLSTNNGVESLTVHLYSSVFGSQQHTKLKRMKQQRNSQKIWAFFFFFNWLSMISSYLVYVCLPFLRCSIIRAETHISSWHFGQFSCRQFPCLFMLL